MGAERKIWDAIAMDVAEVEAKEAAISAAEEEAADDGFSMVPYSPLTLDISLPLPLLKPHITYYFPPLSLVYGNLGFLFPFPVSLEDFNFLNLVLQGIVPGSVQEMAGVRRFSFLGRDGIWWHHESL